MVVILTIHVGIGTTMIKNPDLVEGSTTLVEAATTTSDATTNKMATVTESSEKKLRYVVAVEAVPQEAPLLNNVMIEKFK